MTEERPTTLRRRPRPAADENVDPIDPRPSPAEGPQGAASADQSRISSTTAPAVPADPPSPSPAPPAVREVTVQLSVKVAPDVVQLIDGAIAAARARGERLTQRAAIEQAIRNLWG